jgi:hypothetical protein
MIEGVTLGQLRAFVADELAKSENHVDGISMNGDANKQNGNL